MSMSKVQTQKLSTKIIFSALLKCAIVSYIYEHVYHKIQGSIIFGQIVLGHILGENWL